VPGFINITEANGAYGALPMDEDNKSLPSQDRLVELVNKANGGNAAALAALRQYLDEHAEIWQKVGDLSQHVQENHIRKIANGNLLGAETLRKRAEWMRKDLAGPNPSSLEKVAVDNVMAAWFERHYVDLTYPPGTGKELAMARFVIQLRSSVQKRYDAAMKSLLLIREKMPAIDEANRKHLRKKRKLLKFPGAAMS
jgi:hypothetical protein